jgi:hypothetical protein
MDENTTITVGDAYRAMFKFLDAYWERGLRSDDEIANLLSSMEYGDELGPTQTMDPAQWHDWLDAVKAIQ